MASTYTPNLTLELQATGEHSGTWGATLNTNALAIIDAALGNVQTISLSSTDVTLNTAQTQVNSIYLTGTLSANVNVIFPAIGRTYYIQNNTTGSFSVTLKITGSGGATVTASQGTGAIYVLDGTNVYLPTAGAALGALTPIASATTTDLGTIASHNASVTGTTTITSFGSSAVTSAPFYFLTFAAALQLTYNGTSMVLPGGKSITTSAGDFAIALYRGSSNWTILDYVPASGTSLVPFAAGTLATIASASTTDLGTAQSHNVSISGTTTINAFGSSASTANPIYFVAFTGILQLTYNATSLILPGGVSITTAAGDTATAQYLGSGNWQVISYTPANGQAVGGSWTQIGGTYSTTSGTSVSVTNIPTIFQQLQIRVNGVDVSGSNLVQIALSSTNGSGYGSPISIGTSAPNTGFVVIDAVGINGLPKSVLIATQPTGTAGVAVDSTTTGLINAIQMTGQGGTFDAGSFTVWGIR
jgi:hypothetical protein